jgi:hypothetical protein
MLTDTTAQGLYLIAQLVKKFLELYRTQRVIIMLTKLRYLAS